MDSTFNSKATVLDDEMAAAVAAVQAFLVEEEEEKTAPVVSPWAVAARREALALDKSVTRIWTALSTALLLSLAAPALAQESIESEFPTPQVAYGPKVSPVVADSPRAGQDIKVCLASGLQKVDLDFPDGGTIYTVADGTMVGRIAPQSSWSLNLAKAPTKTNLVFQAKSSRDKISPASSSSSYTRAAFIPSMGSFFGTDSKLVLPAKNTDSSVDASLGYIAVPDSADQSSAALLGVNGKLYRGAVVLKPMLPAGAISDTSISVINVLNLEDYLLSVVPSEVPSLWPKEVLKAQAIAARSYAVANLGKHKVDGYDVKATVDDQVYRGVVAESLETNQAVAETSGLVLKNNNKVISAFFHSTSGGSTEVSENVWGKPLPYLKSVVDYDDASPQFNWKKSVTSQAIGKLLPDNQVLGVLVVGRYPGDSQRVKDVLVVGPNSARVIAGTELRRLFNLPSTQFSLFQSDSSYIFSGRGYGHGLGLSQWGAKALADNGYNAEQILSYYYKDVTIEPLAQDGAI